MKIIIITCLNFLDNNISFSLQTASKNRINQNIYYRAPRRFIANDRINARTSTSRDTNYIVSESTPSRPGGTPAQAIINYEPRRGSHKYMSSQEATRTASFYSSQDEEDLEWLDKIIGTPMRDRKKLLPKPIDKPIPPRPRSILKSNKNYI